MGGEKEADGNFCRMASFAFQSAADAANVNVCERNRPSAFIERSATIMYEYRICT